MVVLNKGICGGMQWGEEQGIYVSVPLEPLWVNFAHFVSSWASIWILQTAMSQGGPITKTSCRKRMWIWRPQLGRLKTLSLFVRPVHKYIVKVPIKKPPSSIIMLEDTGSPMVQVAYIASMICQNSDGSTNLGIEVVAGNNMGRWSLFVSSQANFTSRSDRSRLF